MVGPGAWGVSDWAAAFARFFPFGEVCTRNRTCVSQLPRSATPCHLPTQPRAMHGAPNPQPRLDPPLCRQRQAMATAGAGQKAKGKGGGGRKPKGLQEDLVRVMYGYGDEKSPQQESVELLENMVYEYINEMCRQVSDAEA